MGAKKKGKANKLARMSEEERIRYLQHRAAIEEEARRRKEQLISTYMKNKLKREEGFSRLNMAKINQEWRQTLRQIKCIEMKQDLEDLFKWFDYSAKKKNKIIEILMDDLDEAESQYSRMHHCHTETIDKLIRIYGQRIGHFYEQYKEEKEQINVKAMDDLNDMINFYIAGEEQLQATLYRMEEACEEKIAHLSSSHLSKMDEIRNNMLTELENLRNARELQIEQIWLNFQTTLKQYWEQTEDRRRQYLIMREADYENCKQIFENNRQINNATDALSNLKEQLAKVQTESCERFLECQTKKEFSRKLLFSFKQKVNEETEDDQEKLIFMNSLACETTENLKRILSKGEQILQLYSLCRKLETLNEKICPEGFDKPQLTEEEEQEIRKQATEYTEPLAEKTFNEVFKLDGLWKRYNRAFLEKEALDLHHRSLLNEQKNLKSILRNHLADLVIKRPESKVSHANGVQTLTQKPQSYVRLHRKIFSAVPCIEATKTSFFR